MSNKSQSKSERTEAISPEDLLDAAFTEADLRELHSIKHELGTCVRWGTLVAQIFTSLRIGVDTLVFLEHPGQNPAAVKVNPYESLFPIDQEKINGPSKKSKMCREYVLLHIIKKLLGALKTHVNQKLAEFDVVDAETEGQLRDLLAESYIANAYDSADEEEMDLVASTDGEIPIPSEECVHDDSSFHGVSAEESESGKDELHRFCRTCNTWLSRQVLKNRLSDQSRFRQKRRKRECSHQGEWVEGGEGKTAICSNCKETISNPSEYSWVKAGLEPFGDDPDQDEIMEIPVGQSRREISATVRANAATKESV